MANNSKVTITNTLVELTDIEKIMFRTSAPTVKLISLIPEVGNAFVCVPTNMITRLVQREGEADLINYVITTLDGQLISTSAAGCADTLREILGQLVEIGGLGQYPVEFSRVPSKKGNAAILCRLVPVPVSDAQ